MNFTTFIIGLSLIVGFALLLSNGTLKKIFLSSIRSLKHGFKNLVTIASILCIAIVSQAQTKTPDPLQNISRSGYQISFPQRPQAAALDTVEYVDVYDNIIVASQGRRIELDSAAVAYILSKTANESIRTVLFGDIQTIRNCDVADNIIAIWEHRPNELLAGKHAVKSGWLAKN